MDAEKVNITTVRAAECSPPSSTTAHHPPCHQERPAWLRFILLLIDIGLALSPLLFLAIAFAAIGYNHKRVSDDPVLTKDVNVTLKEVSYSFSHHFSYRAGGQAVIDVAQVAVSVFPILFAAIVGRFMKSWALRRAERGSTMGVLEQLYGSQNLSNAVQLLFALRGPGILGVAVVFVWLLSPLGGQGVKRVLGTTLTHKHENAQVFYCNTSSSNSSGIYAGIQGGLNERPAMNDAFGSLFFTDSSSTKSDIFGNVKIPYLSQTRSGYIYSAMAGLLIDNLPNDRVTTFNVTTSYVDMVCEDALEFDYNPYNYSSLQPDDTTLELPQNFTGYQNFLDWLGPLLWNENMTNLTDPYADKGNALIWDDWQYIIDVKLDKPRSDETASIGQQPKFVFVNQNMTNESTYANVKLSAYECTASIQWLEAELWCTSDPVSPCSVNQTRAVSQPTSQDEHPIFAASTKSYLDGADVGIYPSLHWLVGFIGQIQKIKNTQGRTDGNYHIGSDLTALNKYLAGAGTYSSTKSANWTSVSGSDLSPRFGSVVNTGWLVGQQYVYLAQPKSTNITLLQNSDPTSPDYIWSRSTFRGSLDYIGYDVTGANAKQITTYEMYQVNWTWVTIAIVISLLLLFLGLLGLFFRHTNNHPDVLGFVSTLTRDNPHFEPPPAAEKLDGMEMASYYKHTKVQLINTAELDEPTRITLKPLHRSSGDM